MMDAVQLAELWLERWCTTEMTNEDFNVFDDECLANGVKPEEVVALIMLGGN